MLCVMPHILRELTAVTETGTGLDKAWARQAITALLALKKAAGQARQAGRDGIGAEVLARHAKDFRDAARAGIVLNAARRSDLSSYEPRCPAGRDFRGSPWTAFGDCGS